MAWIHTIQGGGGTRLHVREWGNRAGRAIVLIHGWSQNHLCWHYQTIGALADRYRIVALDLRGHGMSECPDDPGAYGKGEWWAEDIAAILTTLELDRPVLVGWSYGGLVIGDYLRRFGQDKIGAVNLVGAAVVLDPSTFGTLIGPGFLDNFERATSDDLPEAIAGMSGFLRDCLEKPLEAAMHEKALCWNIVVPSWVRRALADRQLRFDREYGALTIPVLVTHGRKDRVVLPSMAEHILATCDGARAAWYEDVGHAPFLEDPLRFDRDLAALAECVH